MEEEKANKKVDPLEKRIKSDDKFMNSYQRKFENARSKLESSKEFLVSARYLAKGKFGMIAKEKPTKLHKSLKTASLVSTKNGQLISWSRPSYLEVYNTKDLVID